MCGGTAFALVNYEADARGRFRTANLASGEKPDLMIQERYAGSERATSASGSPLYLPNATTTAPSSRRTNFPSGSMASGYSIDSCKPVTVLSRSA